MSTCEGMAYLFTSSILQSNCSGSLLLFRMFFKFRRLIVGAGTSWTSVSDGAYFVHLPPQRVVISNAIDPELYQSVAGQTHQGRPHPTPWCSNTSRYYELRHPNAWYLGAWWCEHFLFRKSLGGMGGLTSRNLRDGERSYGVTASEVLTAWGFRDLCQPVSREVWQDCWRNDGVIVMASGERVWRMRVMPQRGRYCVGIGGTRVRPDRWRLARDVCWNDGISSRAGWKVWEARSRHRTTR